MVKAAPLLLLLAACAAPAPAGEPPAATFSIVALDPETGELGVAVQSRFVAVGAVVPWAKGGVGAVATQSYANTSFGPRGLEALEKGGEPGGVLDALLAADEGRDQRQAGMVDAQGRSATRTGTRCLPWAGGRRGPGYAVQGNLLAGEAVVEAMEKAFLETPGELSDRLLAALQAGQDAGGDVRGKQSAALLVVRGGWGYGGFNDRYRDLRVDEHPDPIVELKRIHEVHRKIFKSRR